MIHPWLQRQLDQFNLGEQILPSDLESWQQFLKQLSVYNPDSEPDPVDQPGSVLEAQQSLSLLQATFNATDAGILALDKAGKICNFNQRFVDFWQIPESLLTDDQAQSILTFVFRQLKQPPHFLKTIMRLSAEPQTPTHDVVEFKDGRTFEVASHPSKVGYKLVGRVWSFRDITERKRVEQALQRRVDFEQLLTGLSTHFIRLSTDEMDQGIQQALAKISQFIGVSRGYLYLLTNSQFSGAACCEWLEPSSLSSNVANTDPQSGAVLTSESMPTTQAQLIQTIKHRIQGASPVLTPMTIPWIVEQLKPLRSIHLLASDLPEVARGELSVLSQFHPSRQGNHPPGNDLQDLQFLTLIPLVCQRSLVGFLRFDATHSTYSWPVDSGGLLKMVAEMFSNALERRRVETALRQAEAKYRSIFENAAEGICQTTLQGQYLSANLALANILGYESSEELMQSLTDIGQQLYLNPDRRQEFIQTVQVEGCVFRFESQVYRRDGSLIWISENTRAARDQAGRLLYFESTVSDITDSKQTAETLKQAKEAAVAASRAKSTFLANMSHELRTPLNAIIGYSEILLEEVTDLGYTDLGSDLERICTAGRDLLALINDILDISKIEAGRMDLYLETFSIPDLIEMVVAMAQPLIDQNGNRVEVRFLNSVSTMCADMTKVRQILLNLLSNAAKFTTTGEIEVSVEACSLCLAEILGSRNSLHLAEPQPCIRFQVKDTGIGMSLDQQDILFQPFTQGDASTTRRYGGTGLGLAISQRFCQMMGGIILVDSELDQGSTFTVILPETITNEPVTDEHLTHGFDYLNALGEMELALKPDPFPRNEAKTRPIPEARTDLETVSRIAPRTVLVIDDDPASRDLIVRSLRQAGLEAIVATNGEEGLRYARDYQPDVITLDIMMPSMDGWAVLSALKADPHLSDIPVIVLSFVSDKAQGFSLGASDYLLKPFDNKRLIGLLNKYQPRQSGLQPDVSPGEILIVEDHQDTVRLLREILEQDGWQVATAEDGQIALDYLNQNQPRLILLDLILPRMNGFEFITELRQVSDWADIPVIVITAIDLTAAERAQLRESVEQILQKGSYSSHELLDEIHQLIRTTLEPLTWLAPYSNSESKL
ncbi:MAG: response regulator [Oscillatoriales cyanobacterium SM2_3_0]|nr:response regulator [Oscillatoriales cyanobacterium SM2_3_0]